MKYLALALLLASPAHAIRLTSVNGGGSSSSSSSAGGSSGQLQYNNGAGFGGVTTSYVGASSTVTFSTTVYVASPGGIDVSTSISGGNIYGIVPQNDGNGLVLTTATVVTANSPGIHISSTDVPTYVLANASNTVMNLSGPIFFISSMSISGSTYTAGTGETFFSTFTLPSGTLIQPGDRIEIECAFSNSGVAPVGEAQSIAFGTSAQDVVQAFDATASDWYQLILDLTYIQPNYLAPSPRSFHINGNSSGGSMNVAMGTGSTTVLQSLNTTSPQLFYCTGLRSSGGTVNFLWMRVSKL